MTTATLNTLTAEDIDQIVAETRSKVAEATVNRHLATWDYDDVLIEVFHKPFGVSIMKYYRAVDEKEWDSLATYHEAQARLADCEDKRMHLQIAMAMREMENA